MAARGMRQHAIALRQMDIWKLLSGHMQMDAPGQDTDVFNEGEFYIVLEQYLIGDPEPVHC